jgi:hypothetical protein
MGRMSQQLQFDLGVWKDAFQDFDLRDIQYAVLFQSANTGVTSVMFSIAVLQLLQH